MQGCTLLPKLLKKLSSAKAIAPTMTIVSITLITVLAILKMNIAATTATMTAIIEGIKEGSDICFVSFHCFCVFYFNFLIFV